MFTIVSKDGYWSNELGWVYTVDDATLFREKEGHRLPVGRGVKWVKVKENMKSFDCFAKEGE